jgi:hypothetical protein
MQRWFDVVLAVIVATAILVSINPEPRPAPAPLPPLPWQEGIGTMEVEGRFADLSSEDIYYATPKGIWRQARCAEVRVPLIEPQPDPDQTVAFVDPELADEYQGFVDTEGPSYYTFNRCVCGYRVEWTCTRVSRYVTAKAIFQGKKYVRFLYDRQSWDEDKPLSRRLSALVVSCNTDSDCNFHCEAATPSYAEWNMQCRGNRPHRILRPAQSF